MLRDGDLRIDLDGDIGSTLPNPTYLFQRRAYWQLLQTITAAHERLERLKSTQEPGELDFDASQAYRTIFVCAQRGAGKSTFVRHLKWGLRQATDENAAQLPRHAQSAIGNFEFLPLVDPTSVIYPKAGGHSSDGEPYAFLRLIIAHILKWYDKRLLRKSADRMITHQNSRESYQPSVVRKNGEELNRLITIAAGDHEDYGLDGIGTSQAAMRLPAEIHTFLGKMCKELQVNALILPLDDVDMAVGNGFLVLEVLRNFLTTPYIQTVVTGDVKLYTLIVEQHFRSLLETQADPERRVPPLLEQMVTSYVTKIFPPNCRITLQPPYDLLDENPIFFISTPTTGNGEAKFAPLDGGAVEFGLFIAVIIKILFWKVPKYLYADEVERFLQSRSLRGLILGSLALAPHMRQLAEILRTLNDFDKNNSSKATSEHELLEPNKDLADMYASLQEHGNEVYKNYVGYPILIEYLALCLMWRNNNDINLGHTALLRKIGDILLNNNHLYDYKFMNGICIDLYSAKESQNYPLTSKIFGHVSGQEKYSSLFYSQNALNISSNSTVALIPGLETSLIIKLILENLPQHYREFGLMRPAIAIGNLIKVIFSSFDFYSEFLGYSQSTQNSRLRGFSRILDCFNIHERYVDNHVSSRSQAYHSADSTGKGSIEASDWGAIYAEASCLLVGEEKNRSKWPEAFHNTTLAKKILEWAHKHSSSHKLPIFITSIQMDALIQHFYKITSLDPKQLSGITLATYLYRAIDQLKAAIIETSEPTGEAYLYQPIRIAGMIDDHPIVKMIKCVEVQKDLEQIQIGRAKDDIALIFELFDSEYVSRVNGRIAGPNRKDLASRMARNIDTLARRAITLSRQDREKLSAQLADSDTSAYQTLRLAWPSLDPDTKQTMARALDVELETLNATYGRKPSGAKPT